MKPTRKILRDLVLEVLQEADEPAAGAPLKPRPDVSKFSDKLTKSGAADLLQNIGDRIELEHLLMTILPALSKKMAVTDIESALKSVLRQVGAQK
jgi:hypothetical protein